MINYLDLGKLVGSGLGFSMCGEADIWIRFRLGVLTVDFVGKVCVASYLCAGLKVCLGVGV